MDTDLYDVLIVNRETKQVSSVASFSNSNTLAIRMALNIEPYLMSEMVARIEPRGKYRRGETVK